MSDKNNISIVSQEDISRYNLAFQRYRTSRQSWEIRGQEYEMFVRNDVEGTGTQFTQTQLKKIQKKYNIPLSVNIGHAIKDQMLAMLTSAEPTLDCVPIGEASKHFAYVWREILLGSFQMNKTRSQLKRTLGHMIDVGHGVLRVRPNRFYKRNIFNCVIECVKWNYAYFDPSSEDPLFQDSELQFIAIPITKSKAKKEYNLSDEELELASTPLADNWNPVMGSYFQNNISSPEGHEQYIWIQDVYEKKIAKVYIMLDGTRTTVKPEDIGVSPEGKLVGQGNILDEYEDVFIQYCLKVGNIGKYQTIMPISMYPNIPFVYTHTDSPYSLGVTHHVLDIYKTANKALGLTIENIQKGGNIGWFAFEGSIIDKDKLEQNASTPGSVTEIEANPSLPNGGMPTQKQVNQLPNAWFTLFRELLQLAKYISGMGDMVQGDSSTAPETANATMGLINQGTQRVKMLGRSVDESMEALCNLVIEFVQAYSPKNNILTYISQTEAQMRIRTDVEGSLQQNQQGQQAFNPQEGGQQMATIIEDMTNEQTIAIVGSVKVGEYKVRYRSSSNLPTTRMMAQQIITSAMARMQGDATAMALLKTSLKLLDIPEIDKALEEADLTQQQANQLNELQQQLEQVMLENKDWEKKYYNEAEKVHLAEIGAKVQIAQSKTDVELARLREGVNRANEVEKKKETESELG